MYNEYKNLEQTDHKKTLTSIRFRSLYDKKFTSGNVFVLQEINVNVQHKIGLMSRNDRQAIPPYV